MSYLIAIDPGVTSGVAVFYGGYLVEVHLIIDPIKTAWRWESRVGVANVVCEIPQYYVGSKVSAQNLITLAVTAGYLIGQFRPAEVQLVYPRAWKGQRSKKVDNQLTKRLLHDPERYIIMQSKIPDSQLHNILDAVGIGLWALKRR